MPFVGNRSPSKLNIAAVFSTGEHFDALVQAAGSEAVECGALDLDWCMRSGTCISSTAVERNTVQDNKDPVREGQDDSKQEEKDIQNCAKPGSALMTSLLLCGFVDVCKQLFVVLRTPNCRAQVKLCIIPHPLPYLRDKPVWIKQWSYISLTDGGYFEVQLENVVVLSSFETSIPSTPFSRKHLHGVVLARSAVFRSSGQLRFLLEIGIHSSTSEPIYSNVPGGHHCAENEMAFVDSLSVRSNAAVMCLCDMLKWWPFLAIGARIELTRLSTYFLPRHGKRLILRTEPRSKLIPLAPLPLVNFKETKDGVSADANGDVTYSRSNRVSAPQHFKDAPIVSYEGEVKARGKGWIDIDNIVILRILEANLLHSNYFLRIGSRIRVSWVLLVTGLHASVELLPTARTTCTIVETAPLTSAALNTANLFSQSFDGVESTNRLLFSNYLQRKLLAKFGSWFPNGSDYVNSPECRCDLHSLLLGSGKRLGLIRTLAKQLCCSLPDRGRNLNRDVISEFMEPSDTLHGINGTRVPRLNELQTNCLRALNDTIPVSGRYVIWSFDCSTPFRRDTEGSNNGYDIMCISAEQQASSKVAILGILKSSGEGVGVLELADDSGTIVVRSSDSLPLQFVGSLICFQTFRLVVDRKEKIMSILICMDDIFVLINGPNFAALPNSALFSNKFGNMNQQKGDEEFRVTSSLSRIERVPPLELRAKDATTQISFCIFSKMVKHSKTSSSISGRLVGVKRPNLKIWCFDEYIQTKCDLSIRLDGLYGRHCAPLLETQKLYVISCPESSIQHLKHIFEYGRTTFTKREASLILNAEFLEVSSIESTEFRSALTDMEQNKVSKGSTVLMEHLSSLSQSFSWPVCDPLWSAYGIWPEGLECQKVTLAGIVRSCTFSSSNTRIQSALVLKDSVFGLVEVQISVRHSHVLHGLIPGMSVLVAGVSRVLSEEGIFLFEDTEYTNVVVKSHQAHVSQFSCLHTAFSSQAIQRIFPTQSLQNSYKREGSNRCTNSCATARLRVRKLIRITVSSNGPLFFKKAVKTDGSKRQKSFANVMVSAHVDDGTSVAVINTRTTAETSSLLGNNPKLEIAIENIVSHGFEGTITERFADSERRRKSLCCEAWVFIHSLFLVTSFGPITIFYQRTRFPELTQSTVQYDRKKFSHYDFRSYGLWTTESTRMEGITTLKICDGDECKRRFSSLQHSLEVLENWI